MGVTNCQRCIDCRRMIPYTEIHSEHPSGISWRCYGDYGSGELKKDICEGDNPPKIAPKWCPRRKSKITIARAGE